MLKYLFSAVVMFFASILNLSAQIVIPISDTLQQHVFQYNETYFLEDTSNDLTIHQVSNPTGYLKFKPTKTISPVTINPGSAYWYRIKIKHNPFAKNNWLLEFFDQTIDNIIVYSPDGHGNFSATNLGSNRLFADRIFQHKNFTLILNRSLQGEQTYYIRVKSRQTANVIIVLRSIKWFITYALDEYFFFGIFYGMILVFGLYNLIMFIAIRQRQYLYYIAYNLSIGLYEMCVDGIAFQYIWPSSPSWNYYAYGIALFLASIFALLFTQSLLNLKQNAPRLYRVIRLLIIFRCIYFLACLMINQTLFTYKFIEIIPLTFAYFSGCYILFKGYRAARFFVVGYSFLLIGFLIKSLIALNIWWFPVTASIYYSLNVCFIMEMLFISFAIGDSVRLLQKAESEAKRRIILELQHNEELKDKLNSSLEKQINERTKELLEKTNVIELQNEELRQGNILLNQQAEEISRINKMLQNDNIILHHDIDKVTHDRIMSADVDFEEFSKTYPDRESCFKFLSDLKWQNGYACRKCSHTNYFKGHLPYSRRCSKCGYEESVIAYTIFQNSRIAINKVFYMIFLLYTSKGKISSHKLSEILSIRQSTCWAYSSRIKKIMLSKKKEFQNAGKLGWSKLIFEEKEPQLVLKSSESRVLIK